MARNSTWAIPDDFDTNDGHWRMAVVCIPDSPQWRGLVRAHINELTYGRYWDERSGSILAVLEIAREIDASWNMNCLDVFASLDDTLGEIVTAIKGIKLTGGCCNGCGDQPDPPPHDGTPPPFGEDEEYETQIEYDEARCRAANAVFDTVKKSINELSLNDIDALVQGGSGLVTGLLLAVVGAAALGWAITLPLAVIGLIVGFIMSEPLLSFSDAKTILEDNQENLVCALYNAPDTDSARVAFMAIVEASPTSALEEQFIKFFLTNMLLNNLFDPTQVPADYEGTVDCSDCGCGDTYQVWRTGDLDTIAVVGQTDGQEIVIASSDADEHNGYHVVRAGVYLANPISSPDCPQLDHQIEFVSLSNDISNLTGGNITAANTDAPWIWSEGGTGLIGNTFNVMFIYLSQLEAFSLTIRVNPVPAPEPLPSNALSIDFDEGDFSEFDSNTTDTSGGHVISVDASAEI